MPEQDSAPNTENRTATAEQSSSGDAVALSRLVESLLFVTGEPLSLREMAKVSEADTETLEEAIRLLRLRYEHSALHIVEIAGGFQMATRPEYAPVVAKLLAPNAHKLSRPALETVTIVAYRQPCTQAEIEAIRGVSVDGVLKTLQERELIQEAGRKQTPGRPILYATTDLFLHYFGLSSLDDLPKMDEDEIEEREREAQTMVQTALTAAGAA
ncbi:MAG: SMC-Scp complex subunit ScpB [Armatimonadaceae bacterium]